LTNCEGSEFGIRQKLSAVPLEHHYAYLPILDLYFQFLQGEAIRSRTVLRTHVQFEVAASIRAMRMVSVTKEFRRSASSSMIARNSLSGAFSVQNRRCGGLD
jgi:hypothetical protein